MTRDCTRFVQLISARIDGALEGPALARLAEHQAGCSSCRLRERALLAQGEGLRTLAASRLDESGLDLAGFSQRVLRAVDLGRRRPSGWARARLALRERWAYQRRWISAGAGVATAAACAAILFFAQGPGPARPPDLATAGAEASVDALEFNGAAGAVFELPGQTTVIWVGDEVTE